MTRFWRNGFHRSSVLGTIHWVNGHWVERVWHRNEEPSYYAILAGYRATERATARYVNPNAECPVCGAPVFFYQNQFGSRVYFDELGPPWPKHPCTDTTGANPRRTFTKHDRIEPALRTADESRLVSSYLAAAGVNLEAEFEGNYGSATWNIYRIAACSRGADASLLILSEHFGSGAKVKYVCDELPGEIQPGMFVYLKDGRLSYFDSSTMEARELDVASLQAALEFAACLVGSA